MHRRGRGGRSGCAASPRSARFARLASAPHAHPLAVHETPRWQSSRPADPNLTVDADIALALREPLRLAQTRIHRALRLRGLLPALKRAFHRGDLSEYDVAQLVDATSCTDDPETLTRVQESTLANL